MASTWQHEPLRTPSGWNSEEKRFAQQVNDILDDVYTWRNRLRFEDFNTATRRRLMDTEGNVSSLEQTTAQLSLRVANYDETKLWQAATEEELLEELEEAGVALTSGILWSDTTNLVIKRYNGTGWDTMQTDTLKTSYITIENDSVSIGSGGKLSIIAGSSFTLEAGSGDDFLGMSTVRADGYRIWAGNSDPMLAPFSVNKTGEMHASKGTIGGFSIEALRLTHSGNQIDFSSTGYFRLGNVLMQTDDLFPALNGLGGLYLRADSHNALAIGDKLVTCLTALKTCADVTLESLPQKNASANLYIDGDGKLFRAVDTLAVSIDTEANAAGAMVITATGSGGTTPYSYEYFYKAPGASDYTSNSGGNTIAMTAPGTWLFYVKVTDNANAAAYSEVRSFEKYESMLTVGITVLYAAVSADANILTAIPAGSTVLLTGDTSALDGVTYKRAIYSGLTGWITTGGADG